ncbi:response regulator transcription factor [Caenibius sp. WL]|uniref:response regulator transcription factor n=1 Tax=Caenibius sp. WL TaxID=2872646 RepID=UPI001E6CB9A0|nr:response regulator transcription factor [Caenibius sp. WL]QZP07026.1 response regulator transcription factor [Caenibius sp. WL]
MAGDDSEIECQEMFMYSLSGDEGGTANSIKITPLIYLVDKDDGFREEMLADLSKLGLNVLGFDGAASFYRAYAARPSDIVVLDFDLDEEDGLSIAAHLRTSQSVGIILIAARDSVDDRINGLRAGADAYVVKPIGAEELAAVVVALNDRLSRGGSKNLSQTTGGSWALVEGGWVLVDGEGHRLRLTTAEQRFLRRLFAERGEAVERRALVEALGKDIYEYNYAHLDTVVSRLRRRAKKANMTLPLHAIRGIGFAFTD